MLQDPQHLKNFGQIERASHRKSCRNADTGQGELDAVLQFVRQSLHMEKKHVATIQRVQNARLWFNFAIRRYLLCITAYVCKGSCPYHDKS